MDALEDPRWYVTLTIFTTRTQGAIHTNNITNLFEEHCIPIIAHTCMHATIIVKPPWMHPKYTTKASNEGNKHPFKLTKTILKEMRPKALRLG